MSVNLKFKSLIAIALFGGFSGSILANNIAENTEKNTKGTDNLAPEVSVVVAKFSFWDMPCS